MHNKYNINDEFTTSYGATITVIGIELKVLQDSKIERDIHYAVVRNDGTPEWFEGKLNQCSFDRLISEL